MSTTIERVRMSDLTPFQEAAAYVAGVAAAGAGAVTVWSKILRGLSADKQARHNDETGKQLYELLVSENKRVDERNRELEIQHRATIERLSQLEIIHSKLLMMTSENNNLKKLLKNKDQQLTSLLNQQSQERDQFRLRLKDYDQTIVQLNLKVEQLQETQLTHAAGPDRRVDDKLNPQRSLTFEDNT